MKTTFVICLIITATIHANIIGISSIVGDSSTSVPMTTKAPAPRHDGASAITSAMTTTSPSRFDVDAELAKIEATCFTTREIELLWGGNILRDWLARIPGPSLVENAVYIIGNAELRKALGFPPPPPWTHFNLTRPSEAELASVPTLEAYFELKQTRDPTLSLDSAFFFENNFPPAIAHLDKRVPAIRTVFRRRFEEMRRNETTVIDRKSIDRMMDEFFALNTRVGDATDSMLFHDYFNCPQKHKENTKNSPQI